MGKITYKLKPFNRNKAYQGALVVAINNTYTSEDNTITNISTDGTSWKVTEDFLGAGVAKASNNNFILTVSSVDYTFNGLGNGIGEAADYILKMGEIATEVVSTGNGVTATTRSSTRREDTGDSTTVTDDTSYVYVDSLTPRDQFAIQALRGILARVDDPSSVSVSVMSTYCDVAYQWAAQMMQAAGNARSTLDDETATEETQTTEVGSLENNTEKLLNNIVAALERTDEKNGDAVSPYWSKPGYENVPGSYTSMVARTLPKEGGGEYQSREEAVADGWTWHEGTSASYSERVSIPNLITWLNNYAKHTPTGEGDTKQYVGLEDLINAIKGISGGGGGGGTSTKSEVLYAYRNVAEAEADGWAYNNEATKWYKTGYNDVAGAHTDEIAQKLPTYRYVQKQSLVEMTKLTESIDKLTAQVKRIADSMTSSNS